MSLKLLINDTKHLIRLSPIASHFSKVNLCQKICTSFYQLNSKEVTTFISELAIDMNPSSLDSVRSSLNDKNLNFLSDKFSIRKSLEPSCRQFFITFGGYKHGTKFLVDLRKHILEINKESNTYSENEIANINAMEKELFDILSLWFVPNFLHFNRVTWNSPCSLLQKISEMEAVHKMKNWIDLKHRVGLYRRCFIFSHPGMVDPITILHTALCPDLATSLHDLIQPGSIDLFSEENPELINAAIFYSVSSPHKGLQGVDFGHSIITNAVSYLQNEFPNIKIFSSLSPIPGFKTWITKEVNNYIHEKGNSVLHNLLSNPLLYKMLQLHFNNYQLDKKELLVLFWELLQNPDNLWIIKYKDGDTIANLLKSICANYLLSAKRPNGNALNPVCNFHLQNGAVVWKINWLSNTRPMGLQSSFGLMVNYRYILSDTEKNRSHYLEHKVIAASDEILKLCDITNFDKH